MRLRKIRKQIEKQVSTIFPNIPLSDITAYISNHSSLNSVDVIEHFLNITEPTSNSLDTDLALLLAQARSIQTHKNKENEDGAKNVIIDENIAKLQEKVVCFEILHNNQKMASNIFSSINKLRMVKRRSRFQDEDYLNRMSFAYAEELKNGYISLDNDDWKTWFQSHPDYFDDLINPSFCCGFIPECTNYVHSITSMLEGDLEIRKIIYSNFRFCGVGVSISKTGSVFFSIFLANRKE